MTDIGAGLLLCGLGGLSEKEVASLLKAHEVQRVIICGRPQIDAHVQTLQKALPLAGKTSSDMYLVPVADSADENLAQYFEAANAFCGTKTLICCRQGASRSATVVAACLMKQLRLTAAEAFQEIYTKRRGLQRKNSLWQSCGQ